MLADSDSSMQFQISNFEALDNKRTTDMSSLLKNFNINKLSLKWKLFLILIDQETGIVNELTINLTLEKVTASAKSIYKDHSKLYRALNIILRGIQSLVEIT